MFQVLLQKLSPNLTLTDGPFVALRIGAYGDGYALLGQRAEDEAVKEIASVQARRGGGIVFEAGGVTFDEAVFLEARAEEAAVPAAAPKKARKPRKKRATSDAPHSPVTTTADTGADEGDEAEA